MVKPTSIQTDKTVVKESHVSHYSGKYKYVILLRP